MSAERKIAQLLAYLKWNHVTGAEVNRAVGAIERGSWTTYSAEDMEDARRMLGETRDAA